MIVRKSRERNNLIEFINGTVDYVSHEYIVIEVNGIGYQVFAPNPFVYEKDLSNIVKVYTHQYVREDVISLYGFKEREEKHLFIKLLNVSGIGPKGALAILASGQPGAVVQAIEREDEKYLTQFPGVGKKTARQIILDLKGKLDIAVIGLNPTKDVSFGNGNQEQNNAELNEAIEALKVLGYADKEITKVVPELEKEVLPSDQYIKKALQLMLTKSRR